MAMSPTKKKTTRTNDSLRRKKTLTKLNEYQDFREIPSNAVFKRVKVGPLFLIESYFT
jgi:hypothetical protein